MTQAPQWSVMLMPWGRVGSNLCADVLLQSGRVRMENEPLTVIKTQNHGRPVKELSALQMNWLAENVVPPKDDRKLIVKLSALSVAAPDEFIAFLRERPPTLVMMDRRDILATAVSALRAEAFARKLLAETGQASWALKKGMTADVTPTVEAHDLRRFINNILRARRVCEAVAAAMPPALSIFYEDLNADPAGVIAGLVGTLGLEPFPYEMRHLKFTAMPLRKSVANPEVLDEVADAFGLARPEA